MTGPGPAAPVVSPKRYGTAAGQTGMVWHCSAFRTSVARGQVIRLFEHKDPKVVFGHSDAVRECLRPFPDRRHASSVEGWRMGARLFAVREGKRKGTRRV